MLKKLNDHNGAALVEFAIVLPVLLLLILGMVEFSLLFYDKAVITNASREGARAGIVYNYPNPISVADVTDVVDNYCGTYLITFGGGSSPTTAVTGQCGSAGNPLTVTVTYQYNFLVLPFISSVTGPINLSAVTQMRCE
jgi:Flp pilus assembly protein TadG